MDAGKRKDVGMDQTSLFSGEAPSPPVTDVVQWYVQDIRKSPIAVENRKGEVHTVGVDGCTCGKSACRHVELSRIVHEKWDTGFRYYVKSAMHKAIRRSDVVEALKWARWCAHFHGGFQPKDYTRRLILEETRATGQCAKWKSLARIPWEGVIAEVAAVKKKWDLVCRDGAFADYVAAYCASLTEDGLSNVDDMVVAVEATSLNRYELFKVFWRVHRAVQGKLSLRLLHKVLEPHALAQGGAAAAWTKSMDTHQPFYSVKMLLEMVAGSFDAEEANLLRDNWTERPHPEDVPFVPVLQDYVFDCHYWEGKQRLWKHWKAVAPGRPMPPGVDLRWSGMLLGVCWREFAAKQFPNDYANRAWEEVDIDPQVWKDALACDRFWYPKFYNRIKP